MSTSLIAHLGSRLNWGALLLMCAATAVTLTLYFADLEYNIGNRMLEAISIYNELDYMGGFYTMYESLTALAFQGAFIFITLGWLVYLALPVHPMKSALLGATITAFFSVSVALAAPGFMLDAQAESLFEY